MWDKSKESRLGKGPVINLSSLKEYKDIVVTQHKGEFRMTLSSVCKKDVRREAIVRKIVIYNRCAALHVDNKISFRIGGGPTNSLTQIMEQSKE